MQLKNIRYVGLCPECGQRSDWKVREVGKKISIDVQK